MQRLYCSASAGFRTQQNCKNLSESLEHGKIIIVSHKRHNSFSNSLIGFVFRYTIYIKIRWKLPSKYIYMYLNSNLHTISFLILPSEGSTISMFLVILWVLLHHLLPLFLLSIRWPVLTNISQVFSYSGVCMCVYIYIYMHTYRYLCMKFLSNMSLSDPYWHI
jgi:hypothetical protein